MLKEVLILDPKITFTSPPLTEEITEVIFTSFSHASFNHGTTNGYGQTELITVLRIMKKDGAHLFHTIDWTSSKDLRVTYSPYGAEGSACADADDRGFHLKQGLNEILHTRTYAANYAQNLDACMTLSLPYMKQRTTDCAQQYNVYGIVSIRKSWT